MPRDQRDEEIAQQALGGEFRPRDPASVGRGFGAVACGVEAAAVDAERDAGEDVRCEWAEDEEGFEERGLVVRSREEEEGVGCVEVGAGEEGEQGGVGDVEAEEEGEGVGGVFLEEEEGGG